MTAADQGALYQRPAGKLRRSQDPAEPRKLLRLPCESWTCRREHEWLPVGPTAALYHMDERAEEPPKP